MDARICTNGCGILTWLMIPYAAMHVSAKAKLELTTEPSGSQPKHVSCLPGQGFTVNTFDLRHVKPSVANSNLASATNIPLAVYPEGWNPNMEMWIVPFFDDFGTV